MELQPFVTQPASALSPEAEFGGRLHGHRAPDANGSRGNLSAPPVILKEQPWHLHAARYIALRMTPEQVAIACECETPFIRILLKQDWFQQRVREFMEADGTKDVMALLNAEAINSLRVLVDIRDDDKASPQVRSSNAKAILEWHLGKPTQRVEVAPLTSSQDPVAEAARLEEEISRERERV